MNELDKDKEIPAEADELIQDVIAAEESPEVIGEAVPDEPVGDETPGEVEAPPKRAVAKPRANKRKARSEAMREFEPEVFVDGKRVYKIDRQPSQALVIHCGDSRFQTAFRTFVTEDLGLKNYTPVIIGGGVHAFGSQSFLPKNFKILWQQVKFFIKEQKLTQVVIINHDDCTWYEKMRGYHGKLDLPSKGKLDLRTAAMTILKDFAGINVRTFWADLDGDQITFREVTG